MFDNTVEENMYEDNLQKKIEKTSMYNIKEDLKELNCIEEIKEPEYNAQQIKLQMQDGLKKKKANELKKTM